MAQLPFLIYRSYVTLLFKPLFYSVWGYSRKLSRISEIRVRIGLKLGFGLLTLEKRVFVN